MTAHPRAPRRQRLGDPLRTPDATARQIACDHAVAPFDRAMQIAEARWKIDRLPELVSPETAAKWGKVVAGLHAAIAAEDAAEITKWVEIGLRGIAALQAEAEASGAEGLPITTLEWKDGPQHFAVIADVRDWPRVERILPGVAIYTLREVAVALNAQRLARIAEIKSAFPGAQMTAIRPPREIAAPIDDTAPFEF